MSLDGPQPAPGMRCDVCGADTELIRFTHSGDVRVCPEKFRNPHKHRIMAYDAKGEKPPDQWQEFLAKLERRAAEKAWDEAIASVQVAAKGMGSIFVPNVDNPYREET